MQLNLQTLEKALENQTPPSLCLVWIKGRNHFRFGCMIAFIEVCDDCVKINIPVLHDEKYGAEYVFYKDKNEYRDVLVAEFPKEFTAFHTIKYDLGE